MGHENEEQLRRKFTDSGFAWIISAMSFFTLYALAANGNTLGVIFPELLHHFNVPQAMIGLLGSIRTATFDLTAGIFIGHLTKKYGCRALAIPGLILTALGILASSYVNDYFWLVVTFSLIPGFGSAGLFIPSNVIVHQYHNKRRALASSLASVGLSFATFTFPVFMRLTIQSFGWRAALVMLASIQVQMVAAAMMFMPNPDLHVKLPLTPMDTKGHTETAEEKSNGANHKPSKVKACNIDVSILKNPAYVLFLFAYPFASSAASTFANFAIQRGIFQGIDEFQASFIMSSFGACSITGRIAAGFIGNLKCTRRDLLSFGYVFTAGIVCIISIFSGSSLILHAVFAGCFGFLNGSYHSLYTTLLVDIVGLSELPKAMGYIQLVKCIISAISFPLAGLLFDVTQDYVATYLFIGISNIIGGVLFLCSGIANRRRRSKNESVEMKECS
ncbi:hypothetical protein CAPTEDRAFT_208364 [Capitella teleta]|uniref:Major facilitator superfamily (MFS) profile domain-containing protein n=1 Tax=Capitella teleta TaxID=283909 RepID=R7U4Z4_CAPTE|nr:hypothetical protein CAPTEDRAFT_208364 [Capitella teleta]|eukprot:ELU01024.1 hypothetical protein CAPTEDRAFT_208364 [Capitella teleta]